MPELRIPRLKNLKKQAGTSVPWNIDSCPLDFERELLDAGKAGTSGSMRKSGAKKRFPGFCL